MCARARAPGTQSKLQAKSMFGGGGRLAHSDAVHGGLARCDVPHAHPNRGVPAGGRGAAVAVRAP